MVVLVIFRKTNEVCDIIKRDDIYYEKGVASARECLHSNLVPRAFSLAWERGGNQGKGPGNEVAFIREEKL